MADNKQYITQTHDKGSVLISEDVIAAIVARAVNEVEGVVGMSAKPGADLVERLSKKNWGKGIKVVIAENNDLTIECNVVISYGHSVVTVANGVQAAVTNAVESMVGVKIKSINVNVCGINRQ